MDDRDLTSIVGKCHNSKINKFIEDINKKSFQRDIVLLLIDIAEKPEICIDYNISISYYLTLYLKCKEVPILSEAGCLILNAAKIYARRVDNIHECLENTMAGFEEVSNKDNSHTEINTSKQKKGTKRALPKHDYLQEYELNTKIFKLSTDEKLYEKEISLETLEPPKRYFSEWKRYKELCSTNKKTNKSNENNEYFIDPALWKYSAIEDFDYEDDIETKRNYQVFTNIIEHRYNTLRRDMNFVMHFKVKDFVEAEEEEDTPTKCKNSLCKNSNNLSDNIKNYIELENTILESEYRNCDNNFDLVSLDFNHKRRKRNEINVLEDIRLPNCTFSTETYVQNNVTDISLDITVENATLNNNTSIEESIPQLEITVPATQCSDNVSSTDQNSVPDANQNDTVLGDNNIEKSNTEIFDTEKIIVRLSMDDEGVFFGDLDDVDRAMLNPRVVATNIARSMENDITNIPNLTVTIDEKFEKFFGIDESNLKENLNGENLKTHINIELNFLKIPVKMLKKRILFCLNHEFDIYKNDRVKRRPGVEKPPRLLKLFKLNQYFTNESKFAQSPLHEPDFIGFTEDEIYHSCYKNKDIDKIKNDFDKFRSISLDSGIAIPELLTNISLDNSTAINMSAENSNSLIENSITANSLQSDTTAAILSSTLIESNAESCNFNNSETIGIVDIDSCNVSNDRTNLMGSQTHVSDMIQKIQLWHRHLKPILSQSKNRHHFDVFELGTEIINNFPNDNSFQCNKKISFKNIMNNKDPSYISRYFLSMLLLANTNNININILNENIDQPCDTDNIQLQLLSRKRHTVSVEDNIGIHKSKRICGSHESVLFPKPNKKIITNSKLDKSNDDNDSGFFSQTSLVTSLS